jgi:tRNA-binding protein
MSLAAHGLNGGGADAGLGREQLAEAAHALDVRIVAGWIGPREEIVHGSTAVHSSCATAPSLTGMATIDDFNKIDMRVGRVTRVEDFPEARVPAWKLWIDFGDLGEKSSSAQITHYSREELHDSLVVAVVNFPPRKIAGFESEVLVLGALDKERDVVLLRPDRNCAPGDKIG